MPARARALRRFWFAGDVPTRFRGLWFRRSAAFDAELRSRFAADVALARTGALDDWAATPAGAIALLLLLDQLPRNLCRGQATAFASDPAARAVTGRMLARGDDRLLGPVERVFMLLPLEHSEDLADQERSVALFEAMIEAPPAMPRGLRDMIVAYARRHHEIVARFGRFPHRNAALGRATTPEEAAFLREPMSSF
ncbi:MAG: DUF924 domain-containing protein [Phreatobacter sp.]|nr:DUF924 domain-containing protein [Phreatobacter sp.]